MAEKRIDWNEIHRRLAEAESSISESFSNDEETVNRILRRRAQELAKPPISIDKDDFREILAFSFAGENYALETFYVQEVCMLKNLAALPGTPPFLAGVMNLRGKILAIIDLRSFFELPPKGITELNRVIVIENEHTRFGLLVDAIEGVKQLKNSDLQENLPTLQGIREKFLVGVTVQMTALLDGSRLLSDEKLKVDMRREPI